MKRLEDIDLEELAHRIRNEGPTAEGYLSGKTALRDRTVRLLGCSQLQAEQLVDTLVARGLVTYDGAHETAASPGVWRVLPSHE